ncbi:LptF/LptG family permease [Chondrinema litorale]|uniref:LptF/LptG family permease n=1 Tax=Chondrinema litorale TaxID=2994555 RepID=UPI002542AEAA|nr:LptF/LptG family permease [Chondrinema litorale]UZR94626.1 LptF/LptG family permease [Chondrinema litorale]
MLKKLDKLIFKVFLGPFFLTFAIVLFIFLTQYMIKNFKHFVGKGLGLDVYAELFGYFSLVLTPVALPLAVLLSSLMTFGSLGEHSELTAIKSSGISLLRILRPVAIYIFFVTIAAFYFNDIIAPYANLKAYSLLYDIKQKKPVLEFKEKTFYNDLPGWRIKVDKKLPDGKSLEGIMIYNHTDRRGNIQVIMAKSGQMQTLGSFLALDLKNGNIYSEESAKKRRNQDTEFFRQEFDSARFLFSLESFGLKETDEEFFKGHNLMKNTKRLFEEKDSVNHMVDRYMYNFKRSVYSYYNFWERNPDGGVSIPPLPVEKDSTIDEEENTNQAKPTDVDTTSKEPIEKLRKKEEEKQSDKKITPKALDKSPSVKDKFKTLPKKDLDLNKDKKVRKIQAVVYSSEEEEPLETKVKEMMDQELVNQDYVRAHSKASSILNLLETNVDRAQRQDEKLNAYEIDIHRKFTKTLAVFAMFLIGAPLGAIIKKGGLGVPVIISIIFFIIFYIATIMGEKYAKEMVISPVIGCWSANVILFAFGLFFLKQARKDARLFDTDFYYVFYQNLSGKIKTYFGKKKGNAESLSASSE